MKPRLAFIDHSFHKRNHSSAFLRELLSTKFTIVDLWDDSWQGKGHDSISVEEINSGNFEYVFFFQSILPIEKLKQLTAHLIWAPMFDAAIWYSISFWAQLTELPIKIVSFSKALTTITQRFALDIYEVTFYLNPEQFSVVQRRQRNVFFWQRTNFTFKHVKQLLGDQSINRLILKVDPDPCYEAVYPTTEEIERYNITLVKGAMTKEQYMQLLQQSSIFIAPRKYEGIGMSFIEAMTMGVAVIAMNHPTMNEYIFNQHNGYLFNERKLSSIDLSSYYEIGKQARLSCEQGYHQWLTNQSRLLDFIDSPYRQPSVLSTSQKILYRSVDCVDVIKKSVQYHVAKRGL